MRRMVVLSMLNVSQLNRYFRIKFLDLMNLIRLVQLLFRIRIRGLNS